MPEARRRAPFELLRFSVVPTGADVAVVELEGRFPKARERFVRRPVLVIEGTDGEHTEIPAVWSSLDGVRWSGIFAVPDTPLDDVSFALGVRGTLLDLPEPDRAPDSDRIAALSREANQLRRRVEAAEERADAAQAEAEERATAAATAAAERAATAEGAAEERVATAEGAAEERAVSAEAAAQQRAASAEAAAEERAASAEERVRVIETEAQERVRVIETQAQARATAADAAAEERVRAAQGAADERAAAAEVAADDRAAAAESEAAERVAGVDERIRAAQTAADERADAATAAATERAEQAERVAAALIEEAQTGVTGRVQAVESELTQRLWDAEERANAAEERATTAEQALSAAEAGIDVLRGELAEERERAHQAIEELLERLGEASGHEDATRRLTPLTREPPRSGAEDTTIVPPTRPRPAAAMPAQTEPPDPASARAPAAPTAEAMSRWLAVGALVLAAVTLLGLLFGFFG